MDKILDKNAIDVVMYHGSCYDGFGCVVITKFYYEKNFGIEAANRIECIDCYHNKPIDEKFLERIEDKNILMCDFSFESEILTEIIRRSKSFMILDHHVTAEKELVNVPTNMKIFDMKKSAVGITWEFFFESEPLPKLFAHIQDRDLWTFGVDGTEEFVCSFYETSFDYNLWKRYLEPNQILKCIEEGRHWLNYKKIIVDRLVRKTNYIIQEINEKYMIVLYCNSSEFTSDVGNEMMLNFSFGDFACIWSYNMYKDITQYSLRSSNDKSNVAVIAKTLGGGGHRNASGLGQKGCQPKLPFREINPYGIFVLLKNARKGHLIIHEEKYMYTLFEVSDINEKWLEEKYMDLLKRNCMDSLMIVFQSNGESISYKNNEIVQSKIYNILYNEQAISQPTKQLQFLVFTSNHMLTFETDKEFDNLFEEHIDLLSEGHGSVCDEDEDEEDEESDLAEGDSSDLEI